MWNRGKWIATDPDIELYLTSIDRNGERMALSYLKCDEAAEMLGVWMARNGNKKTLISVLKLRVVE